MTGVTSLSRLIAGCIGVPAVAFCASVAGAGTHRFDHVEFQSFAGGNTTVVAINQAGQVAGTSGGPSPIDRQAFISDSTGALTPINTLGLSSSVATCISDAGHIAGSGCMLIDETCAPVAFRYSASTGMEDLGTPIGGKGVDVAGVNVHGDVAGFWTVGEQSLSEAFIFTDRAGMQDLGSLGHGFTHPRAINDAAMIVGQARGGALPSHMHAFHWQNGAMLDLGTFGGIASEATDINRQGTIVGWALDEDFESHAFLFESSKGMQPLPLPKNADASAALAINDAGMILVSFMRPDLNSGMAVVVPHGRVIEIPLLPDFPTGSAIAMNDLGHVVGANVKVIGSKEIVSAFYWSEETGTIQLDEAIISDLPWTIFKPVAINDADEILVQGFQGGFEVSAFVRPALPGDVNGDRAVNIDDLLGVIAAWGACPSTGGCHADVNGTGVVDIDDLLEVISNWG